MRELGKLLDMVTDRLATSGLLVVLALEYQDHWLFYLGQGRTQPPPPPPPHRGGRGGEGLDNPFKVSTASVTFAGLPSMRAALKRKKRKESSVMALSNAPPEHARSHTNRNSSPPPASGLLCLDIASHWLQMYSQLLLGKHHKDMGGSGGDGI